MKLRGPLLTHWRAAAADEGGTSAVEFALIAPMITSLLFGILALGVVLNNYAELANGTRASARQLALSRGLSSPYTLITSPSTSSGVFQYAAPNLTMSGPNAVTLVIAVNGQTCTDDSTCAADLVTAQGQPVTVTAVYGCNLGVPALNKGCQFSATTQEIVE